MARRLALMAAALFLLNGVVLALGAQAWGWAVALFAAAAVVGLATGALGRPPGRSTAPARQAQDAARRGHARLGTTADALR